MLEQIANLILKILKEKSTLAVGDQFQEWIPLAA